MNNLGCSGNAAIPGAGILLFASSPEQWPENPRSVRCAPISIAPPGPREQDEELYPAIPAGIAVLFVLKGFLALESEGKEPGAKKGAKKHREGAGLRRICGAAEREAGRHGKRWE